ncbi:hypothetical protein HDU76_000523, partial [Blyttiomyces sp. JEL0837]
LAIANSQSSSSSFSSSQKAASSSQQGSTDAVLNVLGAKKLQKINLGDMFTASNNKVVNGVAGSDSSKNSGSILEGLGIKAVSASTKQVNLGDMFVTNGDASKSAGSKMFAGLNAAAKADASSSSSGPNTDRILNLLGATKVDAVKHVDLGGMFASGDNGHAGGSGRAGAVNSNKAAKLADIFMNSGSGSVQSQQNQKKGPFSNLFGNANMRLKDPDTQPDIGDKNAGATGGSTSSSSGGNTVMFAVVGSIGGLLVIGGVLGGWTYVNYRKMRKAQEAYADPNNGPEPLDDTEAAPITVVKAVKPERKSLQGNREANNNSPPPPLAPIPAPPAMTQVSSVPVPAAQDKGKGKEVETFEDVPVVVKAVKAERKNIFKSSNNDKELDYDQRIQLSKNEHLVKDIFDSIVTLTNLDQSLQRDVDGIFVGKDHQEYASSFEFDGEKGWEDVRFGSLTGRISNLLNRFSESLDVVESDSISKPTYRASSLSVASFLWNMYPSSPATSFQILIQLNNSLFSTTRIRRFNNLSGTIVNLPRTYGQNLELQLKWTHHTQLPRRQSQTSPIRMMGSFEMIESKNDVVGVGSTEPDRKSGDSLRVDTSTESLNDDQLQLEVVELSKQQNRRF